MNYLAFIVPCYALALGVPGVLAIQAAMRLRAAQRRARDLEPVADAPQGADLAQAGPLRVGCGGNRGP